LTRPQRTGPRCSVRSPPCSGHRLHSLIFFFSSRRRHTRCLSDWSSDVCSSDLNQTVLLDAKKKEISRINAKYDADRRRYVELTRSEERRVGKECRSRWAAEDWKKKGAQGVRRVMARMSE